MSTQHKFTEDQVRWILTERISGVQKAKQLNCSRQTIQNVLLGKYYADVLPEIPRIEKAIDSKATSCHRCIQWVTEVSGGISWSRCALGFPEPVEEGPGFARYCNVFKLKVKGEK